VTMTMTAATMTSVAMATMTTAAMGTMTIHQSAASIKFQVNC